MPDPLPAARVRALFGLDLGPYRLRVQLKPKAELGYANRNCEADVNTGELSVAGHLRGRRLLEAFVFQLVCVVHYVHGVGTGASEEQFTYSFAAGMVEFARRNPRGWRWFNQQLSSWLRPDVPFEHYASGQARFRERAPSTLRIGGLEVAFSALAPEQEPGLYGYFEAHGAGVKLQGDLRGPHLAVIALHELTHALHHVHGLDDGDTDVRFARCQAQMLLAFIRDNPRAWAWLVATMRSLRRPASTFLASA